LLVFDGRGRLILICGGCWVLGERCVEPSEPA